MNTLIAWGPLLLVILVWVCIVFLRAPILTLLLKRKVRIIAVPAGEAPLWVREKWVGLELPVAQISKNALIAPTFDILSRPKNFLSELMGCFTGRYRRESGFIVPSRRALLILENSSPEAANWWRSNAPHLWNPFRCFLFDADACEIIT